MHPVNTLELCLGELCVPAEHNNNSLFLKLIVFLSLPFSSPNQGSFSARACCRSEMFFSSSGVVDEVMEDADTTRHIAVNASVTPFGDHEVNTVKIPCGMSGRSCESGWLDDGRDVHAEPLPAFPRCPLSQDLVATGNSQLCPAGFVFPALISPWLSVSPPSSCFRLEAPWSKQSSNRAGFQPLKPALKLGSSFAFKIQFLAFCYCRALK